VIISAIGDVNSLKLLGNATSFFLIANAVNSFFSSSVAEAPGKEAYL